MPNRFVYGASKAAVIGLTKAVAADFVQKGIRCNAIAPGTVDTPSLGDRINAFADPGGSAQDVHRAPADGAAREGRGDRADRDLLASDESAFVTGQVFCVDGGMTI